MDPLVAISRLPSLAQSAMRAAVLVALERGRVTPRALIDDALVRFERAVQAHISEGVRPAILFSERDRILRELHVFIGSRFATRLAALRSRDVVAVGREAAPFDAIVRGKRGAHYGVVMRRLAQDGRRLETLRGVAKAAERYARHPLDGVVVFDFTSGSARLVREAPARVPRAAFVA